MEYVYLGIELESAGFLPEIGWKSCIVSIAIVVVHTRGWTRWKRGKFFFLSIFPFDLK